MLILSVQVEDDCDARPTKTSRTRKKEKKLKVTVHWFFYLRSANVTGFHLFLLFFSVETTYPKMVNTSSNIVRRVHRQQFYIRNINSFFSQQLNELVVQINNFVIVMNLLMLFDIRQWQMYFTIRNISFSNQLLAVSYSYLCLLLYWTCSSFLKSIGQKFERGYRIRRHRMNYRSNKICRTYNL